MGILLLLKFYEIKSLNVMHASVFGMILYWINVTMLIKVLTRGKGTYNHKNVILNNAFIILYYVLNYVTN